MTQYTFGCNTTRRLYIEPFVRLPLVRNATNRALTYTASREGKLPFLTMTTSTVIHLQATRTMRVGASTELVRRGGEMKADLPEAT